MYWSIYIVGIIINFKHPWWITFQKCIWEKIPPPISPQFPQLTNRSNDLRDARRCRRRLARWVVDDWIPYRSWHSRSGRGFQTFPLIMHWSHFFPYLSFIFFCFSSNVFLKTDEKILANSSVFSHEILMLVFLLLQYFFFKWMLNAVNDRISCASKDYHHPSV